MSDKNGIGNRIARIIVRYGETKTKFSTDVGISLEQLNNIINGKDQPSEEFIQKILESFTEIDAEWLATGDGEMLGDMEDSDGNANNAYNEPLKLHTKEGGNAGMTISNEDYSKMVELMKRQMEIIQNLKNQR